MAKNRMSDSLDDEEQARDRLSLSDQHAVERKTLLPDAHFCQPPELRRPVSKQITSIGEMLPLSVLRFLLRLGKIQGFNTSSESHGFLIL